MAHKERFLLNFLYLWTVASSNRHI